MRQEFLAQYVGPNDEQSVLHAWLDFVETADVEEEGN